MRGDYDTLTGLYNRRYFQRESEKPFHEHPEKLKHAAFLVMIDHLIWTTEIYEPIQFRT